MLTIGIDASRANLPEKTGTEWYAFELIRALAPLARDARLELYAKTPLQEGLRDLGEHVRERVLGWPPRRLWTQLRLSAEMALHRPDVLFVPAHTIPLLHPRATVTTAHDLGFLRFPELYAAKELAYHRWSMSFGLKHARMIITPSQFTKDEILSYHPTMAEDRIVPIHHGFNPGRFRRIDDAQATNRVLERYGIHTPFFLFVGRLQEKKNTPGLVRAFGELCTSGGGESLQLVLIGKPDHGFDRVRELIAAYGIADRVLLPGYASADDLPYLLNAARAFLFPSFYEGFGFPILEAQACGTPVLTSTSASMPEVGGDGAYYVDPHDTGALVEGMRRLATDETLRASLTEKGSANLTRFTWRHCAEETYRVLRQAAA